MRELYLKGHGEEFKGGEYNPVTETQESILKAIEIALGETYSVNTSKSAWNVIKTYEDRIMLRYYTDDENEIPEICIDGKEVYKKYVPLTKEQEFIRETMNYYYGIDIKLNDRYKFQYKLLTEDIKCTFNECNCDTIMINNKLVRIRYNDINMDEYLCTYYGEDKNNYLNTIVRMRIERVYNELIDEEYQVSDKLKETPKVLELLEKERKRKAKNNDIRALRDRMKKCKR